MATITEKRKIHNQCRTCLNDMSLKMYDIFNEKNDSTDVAILLMTYTSIKIYIDDRLPKKLCGSCYNCLISFHSFKKLAQKIDAELHHEIDISLSNSESIQNPIPSAIKLENENTNNQFGNDSDCNDEDITLESRTDKDSIKKAFKNNSKDMNTRKVCTADDKTKLPILKKNKENKLKQKTTARYTCIHCSETFKFRTQLINHFATHNNDTGFKSNKNKLDVSNHSFECDTCSARFPSPQSLSAHKKKHASKDRILECSVCRKIFKKLSQLKSHELCHQDNHYYKCSRCPKKFLSDGALNSHLEHHNRTVKPHKCPICAKEFCYIASLSTHIKTLHNTDRSYLCPTCGKKFSSSSGLKRHHYRHLGLKTFACTMCPKTFITKEERKLHEISHTSKRPFTCEQCGATFKMSTALASHGRIHAGVKPYQCDICHLKFMYKALLARHSRTHSGERPHACAQCGRAFLQPYDLVQHTRTHRGALLFECDQCSQSFRLKTELRRHLSDHFISSNAALQRAPTEPERSEPSPNKSCS